MIGKRVSIVGCGSHEEAGVRAARKLVDTAGLSPNFSVIWATGSTQIPVYNALLMAQRAGPVDQRRWMGGNLDELLGLERDDPNTYLSYMQEHYYSRIGMPSDRILFPHWSCPVDEYDTLIWTRMVRPQVVMLGIGENGHIAFNEPGTPLFSVTHKVTLSERTRRSNAVHFGGDIERYPREAVTMGILSILNARHIFILAVGERKAEAVRDAREGEIGPQCPASFLRLHPSVTWFLDGPAMSLLSKR